MLFSRSFLVFALIAGLSGVLASVPAARAAGNAGLSLSASSQAVAVGQSMIVDIVVTPNSESIDTIRAVLTFPAYLLEAEVFQFGSDFSKASPANFINNSDGVISQGGFTFTPATSNTLFGRVTFKAKGNGYAVVKVSPDSRLISAGEEKISSAGLGAVLLTVGTPAEGEAVPSLEGSAPAAAPAAPEAPEGPRVAIASSTHPSPAKWSNKDAVLFTWSVRGEFGPDHYLVGFNESPSSAPTERAELAKAGQGIAKNNVGDGVWYAHVQAVDAAGVTTPVAHYRFRIDTTAPNAIAPTLDRDQLNEGEDAVLQFGTTDDGSGISHYEVSVNDGPYEIQESPYTISDLKQGNYYVEVKAVDNAGNETFGLVAMRVYPSDVQVASTANSQSGGLWASSLLKLAVFLGIIILLARWTRRRPI